MKKVTNIDNKFSGIEMRLLTKVNCYQFSFYTLSVWLAEMGGFLSAVRAIIFYLGSPLVFWYFWRVTASKIRENDGEEAA